MKELYMNENAIGNRIEYLDALRTIACFSVVMLHVSALNTYHVEFGSYEWNVFMTYESLVNWAVPVFVMISGAVMLRKEYSVRDILGKIKRVVIVFYSWSIFYLFTDVLLNGINIYVANFLWLQVLIQGHYHLWYFIMLCGLYLILPITKRIVTDESLMHVFIILAIVLTFIIPTMRDLPQLSSLFTIRSSVVASFYRGTINLIDDMHFHLTLGYTAYYLLGYWIVNCWKEGEKPREFMIGLFTFLLGVLILAIGVRYASSKKTAGLFLYYYQVWIFVQACGAMIIARSLAGMKFIKILAGMSPSTLGIYIVHPVIIEVLQRIGITTLSFNPWFSVPILAFLVFIMSAVITKLILASSFRRMVNL